MKSIIEISGTHFLLPGDDAVKVMKLMARAATVIRTYATEGNRERFQIAERDYRNHWVLSAAIPSGMTVELVQDDQIHIPKELAEDPGTAVAPQPARRGNRLRAHRQQLLLGNGGGQ